MADLIGGVCAVNLRGSVGYAENDRLPSCSYGAEKGFQGFEHGHFGDVFQAAWVAKVTMRRKAEAPGAGVGGPEQADAGNATEICRVKHAGIGAEEQIAFLEDGEGVGQGQAARMNDTVLEFAGVEVRAAKIEDENHEVGMARKKCGCELAKTIRGPHLFGLGFVVNSQDALAGRDGFQKLTYSRCHAGGQTGRKCEVGELQRGI